MSEVRIPKETGRNEVSLRRQIRKPRKKTIRLRIHTETNRH